MTLIETVALAIVNAHRNPGFPTINDVPQRLREIILDYARAAIKAADTYRRNQ